VCVVRNGPVPVPQCILADAPTIASRACRGSFAASVVPVACQRRHCRRFLVPR